MDQGLGVSQIEPATTNSYMTSVEVWWWHFCHLHLLVIMFCFFHFSYTKRTQIPQIILVYISSFVKKSGAWPASSLSSCARVYTFSACWETLMYCVYPSALVLVSNGSPPPLRPPRESRATMVFVGFGYPVTIFHLFFIVIFILFQNCFICVWWNAWK